MDIHKETSENGEGERDPLTQKVIGCAIEVHRYLGPGLLESAYEQCLAHELALAGLAFFNVVLLKHGIRRLFQSPSPLSLPSL